MQVITPIAPLPPSATDDPRAADASGVNPALKDWAWPGLKRQDVDFAIVAQAVIANSVAYRMVEHMAAINPAMPGAGFTIGANRLALDLAVGGFLIEFIEGQRLAAESVEGESASTSSAYITTAGRYFSGCPHQPFEGVARGRVIIEIDDEKSQWMIGVDLGENLRGGVAHFAVDDFGIGGELALELVFVVNEFGCAQISG